MTTEKPTDLWRYILLIAAIGNIGNALWMLASPTTWYEKLPGRIPDYGPMNEHFVRDIGMLYLMVGAGMVWAAFHNTVRVPLMVLITFWNAGHALLHVYDTARGFVDASHWAMEVPTIYGPTLALVVITAFLIRAQRSDNA